jgi:excisionase family DNA binding protein
MRQPQQEKRTYRQNQKKLKIYPQEYLSIQGVAQVLEISERKAHELIHRRDDPIPFHRIGSKIVRVRLSDLHAWMARRREDVSQVDRVVDDVLKGL